MNIFSRFGVVVALAATVASTSLQAGVVVSGSMQVDYNAFLSGNSDTYINHDTHALTELYTDSFYISDDIAYLNYHVDYVADKAGYYNYADVFLFRIFSVGGWQSVWSGYANDAQQFAVHSLETGMFAGQDQHFDVSIDLTAFHGQHISMGLVWVSDTITSSVTQISNLSFGLLNSTALVGTTQIDVDAPSAWFLLLCAGGLWRLQKKRAL